MNLQKSRIIFVTIICFFSNFLLASDWTLKKDKGGITVFTRDVPGSRFKEAKAEAEVNTSLAAALKVVEDIGSYHLWVPDISEMKVLAKISDNESIVYEHEHTMFLVQDRDCIIRVTKSKDSKTNISTLKITSLPDYMPKRKGIVRLKKITASWTFIPNKDKGTVKITYQMYNEPGGHISAGLSNGYIVKRVFTMITNLEKMVQRP